MLRLPNVPCRVSVLVSCLSALPAQAPAEAPAPKPPPGLTVITAKDLREYTAYLASDEMQGRLTGTPGQERAADYIVRHFEAIGLTPRGSRKPLSRDHTWRQRYKVVSTSLDAEGTGITVGAGDQAKERTRGFAVIPEAEPKWETLAVKSVDVSKVPDARMVIPAEEDTGSVRVAPVDLSGEFVYAGLVNTRRFKKGVELEDWSGKIPVFVIDLPKTDRRFGIEQQMGAGMFLIMNLKRRADRLAKLGAKAGVFCILDDAAAVANMLTYVAVAPGQPLMSRDEGEAGQMAQMSQVMRATVPMVFTGREVSLAILAAIGVSEAVARNPEPESVQGLQGAAGRLRLALRRDSTVRACNVAGMIPGSDPLQRQKAIIYSAHMDHVGLRLDGDAYNGADDNASGTAGLLAIAKAYASLKTPPKCTVIFLSVSGEELGLWGSDHYVKNPSWPRVDTLANINIDMIGRNGPESGPNDIGVTPSFHHPGFSTIVRDAARVAQQLGISFTSGDKYYARSDHYNFAKVGVPVVFFCNGEHEDYHQVSDHPDKLDPAKMERIARLAYWTGYLVAQSGEKPAELGRCKDWSGESAGR